MPILTDQERLGTTIGDGKYTLERVLGRGGMGTVFEGLHAWTGRRVAVKLLRHEMAADQQASQRYLQEARSATAIEHPNVVEVLDMGRHDENTVYMVFELLRGESLADRLDAAGALDVLQAVAILLPIADALAAAHRLGIVHRDVKPENIFLAEDGMGYVSPKLLDFGISRVSRRESGITRTGVVAGTPGYLSPEHAQGFRAGPAADVWSLGVVLFECLSGYCPFDGDTIAAVILAIVTQPIPSLRGRPEIPEAIADLLERTLVREPAERFPDGGVFRDALAAAAQVDFVPSRSRSVPPKILLESGELSLSSEHRVEVRQSNPSLTAIPTARPNTPTPVPAHPRTVSWREVPLGEALDAHSRPTSRPRVYPEHVPTLDAMAPVDLTPSADEAPLDATPARTEDADMPVAAPAWTTPAPERSRFRAARFAIPVLLLCLVAAVLLATRTPDPGSASLEERAPPSDDRAAVEVPTAVGAAPTDVDRPTHVEGPAPVRARTEATELVEPAPAAAADVPAPVEPTSADAPAPNARSQRSTATRAVAAPLAEAERAAPRPPRTRAAARPNVERGANGSLILD